MESASGIMACSSADPHTVLLLNDGTMLYMQLIEDFTGEMVVYGGWRREGGRDRVTKRVLLGQVVSRTGEPGRFYLSHILTQIYFRIY